MDDFNQFVRECRHRLKAIAGATRGAYELDDVIQEAWLMAQHLQQHRGLTTAFLDPAFQDSLFAFLYQHLAVYQDKKLRGAKSMEAPYSPFEENTPALSERLTTEDGRCPTELLAIENSERNQLRQLAGDTSEANAYVILLSHFRQNMQRVARHLRISRSYAYHRCSWACQAKSVQHDMNFSEPLAFSHLGPWRKEKRYRIPQQLAFDFSEYLPFA
jgi:hypothetical protein